MKLCQVLSLTVAVFPLTALSISAETAPAPASVVQSKGTPARGPLRVHPTNPRYFTDGSGKAILLTGSHTWGNLQDYRYATLPSPQPMDFGAYLAFLQRHHHNFFRLWVWETAFNPNVKQGSITYDPLPYQRTGPGDALDGKPKFDLDLFNPSYFERMRARVMAARDNGVYVAVMLFNGFSVEGKGNVGGAPWQGHPFHPRNNVNGLDGVGGKSVHTLANPAVTARQEAYVRKVIDTVNDLDNVLYEITNEDPGTPAGVAWQIHMVQFIKQYEATRPRQHPVGMTACWPEGNDATLLASPADWISPTAKLPVADGRKVVLNDTDHSYFWTGLKADGLLAQRIWVWENFTRGSQCLFMDPYLDPSHDPGRNNPVGGQADPYWDTLRQAMGQARSYAERMNLAAAVPHGELASTGFCLADPGKEYLVFLPRGGELTVDLSAASGELTVEWLSTAEGTATRGDPIPGGGQRTLKPPFTGDGVLYLSMPLAEGRSGAAESERPLVVELWPGQPPEENGNIGPERIVMSPKLDRKQVEVTEPTRMVTDVTRPTLTIYRPAKDKETGTVVLICPGGGYWNLYWELEGEEVASWLNRLGVTGIILKYRVPRRPDEIKGEPARRPLQDAQRAVSLVRSKAKEWSIHPQRIGMVGFSAGGHLAIATATSFENRTYEVIDEVDKVSCRPDFAISAYSGYLKVKDKDELAPAMRVPAGMPPIFLAHGGDDLISPPQNSVLMYLALKQAGVPAELHVYGNTAHDFGVRPSDRPCSTWTEACANWLRYQGFLTRVPGDH